jgi:hypothetical protein
MLALLIRAGIFYSEEEKQATAKRAIRETGDPRSGHLCEFHHWCF